MQSRLVEDVADYGHVAGAVVVVEPGYTVFGAQVVYIIVHEFVAQFCFVPSVVDCAEVVDFAADVVYVAVFDQVVVAVKLDGRRRGIVAGKAGTVTREVMLRTLVWRALGALTCKGTCLPLQHFLPYKTIKATRFCCFSKNCFIFEFLIKASAPQRPSRAFCICPILLALAGGGILALQVLAHKSSSIPKQPSKQP